MIAAGKMTERVEIWKQEIRRGEFGEQEVSWRKSTTVWANVVFQRGVYALAAGEAYMSGNVTITMRNNRCVTDRCRLRWDGKLYRIDSFNRSRTDGSITIVAAVIDEGSGEQLTNND